MKIKTSELTDTALDWAVAKCEGVEFDLAPDGYYTFKPSTSWAIGGPIIEREGIGVFPLGNERGWAAGLQSGPTPLIAAMRCYVASRLGDEVDVPEGL